LQHHTYRNPAAGTIPRPIPGPVLTPFWGTILGTSSGCFLTPSRRSASTNFPVPVSDAESEWVLRPGTANFAVPTSAVLLGMHTGPASPSLTLAKTRGRKLPVPSGRKPPRCYRGNIPTDRALSENCKRLLVGHENRSRFNFPQGGILFGTPVMPTACLPLGTIEHFPTLQVLACWARKQVPFYFLTWGDFIRNSGDQLHACHWE